MPSIGVTTSPPALAAPTPIPIIAIAVNTAMPTMTPNAARKHPARPRQRRGQQELQATGRLIRGPARHECRCGEAGEDEAEFDEQELEEPADGAHVDAREDRSKEALEVGRVAQLRRRTIRPIRRAASPKMPSPRPHARAVGRLLPTVRPAGPRSPRAHWGRLGVGSDVVTPMSRRTNASMPTTKRTTATTPTRTTDGQSY